MRITLFLLLASILQTFANDTYSQKTKLSLDFPGTKLVDVLDEIESNTEFYFLFNEKLIDTDRKVNMSVKNEKIDVILDQLFEGTDVVYSITDRKIILAPSFLSENQQQQKSVSGSVTDDTGQPVPGVTVLVKGTTQGTVTNMDGNYSITNIPDNATLVFSFVGMITQEVVVENQTSIDMTLKAETFGIEEVVAIGYGTIKKKDLTGSVGQIQSESIRDLTVTRVDQALTSKIAGVQVIQESGEPGLSAKIKIRGVGSISAGTDPLYVVDGFPVEDIQNLNPNNIKTIDVLKDASATAIYGSRGANGVLLITTKRGKAGKAVISLDAYYGVQKVLKVPEFLTMMEQAQYYLDGYRNQNLDNGKDVSGYPTTWASAVPGTVMDVLEGRNTVNSDAYSEIFRAAPIQNYNLTANGGTEAIQYNVSGEYMNQQGIVIETDFQRYSLRGNLDAKLSDRVSMKFNFASARTNQKDVPDSGGSGGGEGSVIGAATTWERWYPLYNEDGSYFPGYGQDATNNVWNPVAQLNLVKRRNERYTNLANLFTKINIINGIDLNVMLGANTSNSRFYKFIPQDETGNPVFNQSYSYGEDSRDVNLNWITETTLNINKSFKDHNFTGLLGYTTQKLSSNSSYMSSRNFPNNLVYTLNAASNVIYQGNTLESEWSLLSYLARANYNYKNRYYVTASIRSDGSSRFGKDRKYGNFPSVALAWRLSDESFIKDVEFINNFKIRASYGETGNNNIGNYAHIATINYLSAAIGGNKTGGYAPDKFANSKLTWEKQRSSNLGLDASFLDNRLSFTVDVFRNVNHELLLDVFVPLITGFESSLQNIGEVENKGWEFTLNTRNFVGDFNWTTDFNISAFKNIVLKLGPEGAPIIVGENITQIGSPLGMLYGYLQDGIFMNQAELDAGPIWAPGTSDRSRVGDIRFKDVSGPDGIPDGIINTYDRTIMGNPYPDFYYGMTNTFSYKNFSLSVVLSGSVGAEVENASDNQLYTRARYKQLAIVKDYWKSEAEPGNGIQPRPNNTPKGGVRQKNSRYITDATYFKINNINLSYSFSDKMLNKLPFSSLRVYATATNPILVTDFLYFNPEVSTSGNPLTPGKFNYNYPVAKSITFGVNVTF